MNILTTHLESLKPESWSTFNSSFQEFAVRTTINFLKDGDKDNLPEADYALSLFQFKAIFENNTALSEISKILNSGTVAFLFSKALCMLRGSESDIQEAVEISKEILKKTQDKDKNPYYFLISGIETGIFRDTFGITQNKDTYKIICNKYLNDVINKDVLPLLYTDIIDFFESLSFSYRGTEDTFSDIFKEYIYKTYIKNDNFKTVINKFSVAVNILIEILKKENAELLTNYMTNGDSVVGIKELSLNFKNKDEVFEIIDQIDEKYIDFYKGKFSIPEGSFLTDEDLDIYLEMLNPIQVINNVTIDQAIKYSDIFKPQTIATHKDFTLDKLNLLNVNIDLVNKLLIENNYLQSELIEIADILSIKQLTMMYCLITPELFYAVNDKAYDIKFIYEARPPLDMLIGNALTSKNFNMEFISEIRKVYGCSTKDIFKSITSFKKYSENMDDKTKKAFEALNKIIND
jgi:hypothetical protein